MSDVRTRNGFLSGPTPFAQQRPRAGRWTGSYRGLPPHDQVTRLELSSGKTWDPSSIPHELYICFQRNSALPMRERMDMT